LMLLLVLLPLFRLLQDLVCLEAHQVLPAS
jgi:hypothetical protein